MEKLNLNVSVVTFKPQLPRSQQALLLLEQERVVLLLVLILLQEQERVVLLAPLLVLLPWVQKLEVEPSERVLLVLVVPYQRLGLVENC